MTSRPLSISRGGIAAVIAAVACLGVPVADAAAAPETSINAGPEGLTNDATPTFGFSSMDLLATFECRHHPADGPEGTFEACVSPETVEDPLADGEHVFEVRAVDALGTPDDTPAARAFTVDTAAPDTSISAGPNAPTNDPTPEFEFSSEAGASFECWNHAVGDTAEAFTACTSPNTVVPSLDDGAYVFEVRAVDAVGNRDGSPATRSYTVDTTAPETSIISGPEGPTDNDAPQFVFSSEAGASFECWNHAVGDTAEAFTACTSPKTVGPSLNDGAYVFEVRAVDAVGNRDPSPATRSYTIDTRAPDTTIASGPTDPTNDATPEFDFSSPDGGIAFECWTHAVGDTAEQFASCTSPTTVGPLANGDYVFEVRAVDAAGLQDPVPGVHRFTVDTTAPDTSIASGPAGPTNDTTPDFSFNSADPGAGFQCRHYPVAGPQPEFGSCSSPATLGPLGDGAYTFEVRAVDAATNADPEPERRDFTVDTVPPQTEITGGPGDTTAASAVFLFSAAGAVATLCRLDGGPSTPCGSPKTYEGLSLGRHHFEVHAVDAAGNQDPTPASHSWQVLKPGLLIPAAIKQATALAKELVQMRRALVRMRLRKLARRRTVLLKTFHALTAGTVDVRARARVRSGNRRRWIAILKGEREVPGAGHHPVQATVTKKGRRLARRRESLPMELRLSFTDLAGRSLWATAKFTLRR